jgi:hypothetical protein
MTATNIILTDTNTYSANIDGTEWFGITPVSRFYVDVMDAIAAGEPVGTPPPIIIPVPDLSFSQLLIGLVTEGWITEAAGEAWLAGTLPDEVLLVIDGLPAEQRFPAKARALRPSVVIRNDALVNAMGTAAGKTSEDMDNFFNTYSAV